MIAGQEPPVDISGLSGARFSEGRTFRSVWGRGTAHDLDPITFEVIRNALVAATDEMVLTLRRSAYSTNIKTRSDFSCAFFDAGLRAVAQGFTQPVHLGSMVEQVPQAVRSYGPENLGPGDVVITNEPFPSGVHLNDVSLISPVFAAGRTARLRGEPRAPRGRRRRRPASIGAFREVFQEGVIIPPVKVVEAGRIVDDVFGLILAQIRSKHETAGDFRAQIAANATGARRLEAFVGRHGHATIVAAMEELLDYTERRTRAEIAALPPGVYEAEGSVDTDGYTDEPVHLRARVRSRPTASPSTSPAATRSGGPRQLDLRADLLGLRVRAEVPDRPRSAGQRRLLPARPSRRSRAAASRTAPGPRPSSAAGRRRPASSTSSSAPSCPRFPKRSRPGRRR